MNPPRSHFLLVLSLLVLGTVIAAAQQPPRINVLESYRRQDPTGRGTFHRFGLLRELDNTASLSAAAGEREPSEAEKAGWYQSMGDILSMQFRANSMLFASDNIFNTEEDEISDTQFAQFVGVSIDATFNDTWSLTNSFDQAWFWHGKGANSANDFFTSTFRQALNYTKFLFNNKASLTIPLSWQFSRLYNRSTGNRTLDTYTYGAAAEFSWFLKPWLIPTFSYQYSYLDSGSPTGFVADKHKHDFNLGLTFIPFEGKRFFIVPSVQYSHEDFTDAGGRRDNAWTPTLTVSWQPLEFLAVDAVGSYTDSDSTLAGSNFDALTGTLFVRLFYNW